MREALMILLGGRRTNSRLASCVAAACWRADPRATVEAAEDHADEGSYFVDLRWQRKGQGSWRGLNDRAAASVEVEDAWACCSWDVGRESEERTRWGVWD
ncbi:hypothetical protein ACJRO7_004480 [Eucalyptus globulus]|uniref:Uncharacterized protein n=1 Tax=Eucalyptus globulus TaxID=34317 RepID=A0ABD3J1D5_EUCGL